MRDLDAELAELERSLEPEDRACLVNLLLESLQETPIADIEAAWSREIERPVVAPEGGEVDVFDAEDVLAEARPIAS